MKKLLYITNIPAPYRQKRFNMMAKIFPEYGIDFEVLYMAKIEPNRKWIITADSYNYPYKIHKGIHPRIGRFFAHFNPGLLMRLRKRDYDLVVVGGMASPTHWLAPIFIPKDRTQIMSIESNLFSVHRKEGFGAKMKRFLLSKADAYQVTGNPQKKYIEFFYPEAKDKSFIKLPNLIDEDVFRDRVALLKRNRKSLRDDFNVDNNTQMWILPAQLISIKGILPLLDLLKKIQSVRLFILGDGPLYEESKQMIQNYNLPVTLVGFVQQEIVIKYYAAADLFILPSLRDASPLTPIEACASGLPLLVSSRIGNLEDVLMENENGWSYDPIEEKGKGRDIVERISKLSLNDLREMGEKSLSLYSSNFDTEKCLVHYAKELIKLN